jgi:hypothetical protein
VRIYTEKKAYFTIDRNVNQYIHYGKQNTAFKNVKKKKKPTVLYICPSLGILHNKGKFNPHRLSACPCLLIYYP